MTNVFEAYHQEPLYSDREPKTIEKYWQTIIAYRNWLSNRHPDVTNAKEYLAFLRDKGYAPKPLLLYYHALHLFFEFIGMPLKLKIRKTETLPTYYDKGDFESLIKEAEARLYHETKAQRQRNKNLILVLGYTGMRRSELLNLVVGDIDFNQRLGIYLTNTLEEAVKRAETLFSR